jgi:GDP-mannose 6-dehydrogenase
MNISVFGLGYVGCINAGCLAKEGHTVIGVDKDLNKIELISNGQSPVIEKDLQELISKYSSNGKITASMNYHEAIMNSDLSFICVGTPLSDEGKLSLDSIYSVAEEIGNSLKKKESFHIVSIRSTVLPGTTDKVIKIIENSSKKKYDEEFTVVMNPEFLREGTGIEDYFFPPFTIIGSTSDTAIDTLKIIYENIEAEIKIVDPRIAELIKFVSNSFHALKVSFSNEVGNICKSLGVDSHVLMDLFCLDDKLNLSPYYLIPGFAYGGSCLSKDLRSLVEIAKENNLTIPVLENIESSNLSQKKKALKLINSAKKKYIGFVGLSFKSGTDDLRESPTVDLVRSLSKNGHKVIIYDKNINLMQLTGSNRAYIMNRIPDIADMMVSDFHSLIEKSEVVVATQEFEDFENIIEKYPNKIFIDLARNTNRLSSGNYNGICW